MTDTGSNKPYYNGIYGCRGKNSIAVCPRLINLFGQTPSGHYCIQRRDKSEGSGDRCENDH